MKFIGLFLIAAIFMLTPVYLLDTFVLPELATLQGTYQNADAFANELVVKH